MRVCHVETIVSGDGTVTVKDIPFPPGEQVEVVICSRDVQHGGNGAYPLRGKPVQYVDPFEGVAENDWDVLQ